MNRRRLLQLAAVAAVAACSRQPPPYVPRITAAAPPLAHIRDVVDLYVDFTGKPDGDPPATLDTGQPVDWLGDNSGYKSQIRGGKLVPGPLPPEGGFAAYYQAQANQDIRAFGARWAMGDGAVDAGVGLIIWDRVFTTPGRPGKTPAHIGFTTIPDSGGYCLWDWSVGDGRLVSVKNGGFIAPKGIWEAAVVLDSGTGYLFLPGADRKTGSRYVTLTDVEITAEGNLAGFADGDRVLCVEHYSKDRAAQGRYPQFMDVWGQYADRAAGTLRRAQQQLPPLDVTY